MDVAIEAIIIAAFVIVMIALAAPLFATLTSELPAIIQLMVSSLSQIAPYFDFARGMAIQLVGSSDILNIILIISILLPVLFFGIELTAKVCNMFVK